MRIMVTLPEDPANYDALTRQAAQLHAEAIRGEIEGLRCPAAQKMALLSSIFREKPGQEAGVDRKREHKLTNL